METHMQGKNAGPLANTFAIRHSSESLPRIFVILFRIAALIAILTSVSSLLSSGQNVQEDDRDLSVRPGTDFYRYANGLWLGRGAIPTDNRSVMTAKTSERVRTLIQDAAATRRDPITQRVGDYYASFVDTDGIEARKLTPLAREIALISGITSKAQLSAYLGSTLSGEVDALIANANHIFGLWINQGFTDSEHNVVHLLQGGLGMPDRDSYIDPSPKMAELRAQYQAHIAAMLKLAGLADADSRAASVLSLEVRIAQAFAPDSDAADVFKQNNPWKRSDFGVKAPGMDWEGYFESAGLVQQADFIV